MKNLTLIYILVAIAVVISIVVIITLRQKHKELFRGRGGFRRSSVRRGIFGGPGRRGLRGPGPGRSRPTLRPRSRPILRPWSRPRQGLRRWYGGRRYRTWFPWTTYYYTYPYSYYCEDNCLDNYKECDFNSPSVDEKKECIAKYNYCIKNC